MRKKIRRYQEKVIEVLSNKVDDFYLAGGTALALFYFKHRESFDLDFFTKNFNPIRVAKIVKELKKEIKKEIVLSGEALKEKKAKIMVFNISFTKTCSLKIDFVEDPFDLLKPLKKIEGMNVLSLEDIYLRKIFAVAGIMRGVDSTGRARFIGGRQEAKDFYDLFCISQTFMNLSKFVGRYVEPALKESLVVWYRSYDRIDMKTGLSELVTEREINYREMERHFKREIDKIIEEELKGL